ncbi:MAG: hypothetical protein ISR61_10010 [Desulfobacteraceae bacterium]|uniref:Uncharacterized protein n=1 Tax=Candidatus Desulfatibia vada TaxID=2841696 RepID=A0A8J6NWD4_9BACT|nr:hypothetical protein [Candidatus Desulfatibia vada]MBL6979273.1 hypothetical protein [Desulfobacteraceae bacterium]
MGADSHDLERICGNCNYSFPSEPFGSDFAICLNDPDLEPYVDDMLENQDFSRCQNLIKQKRFSWEQEACPDFDPVELNEEFPFSSELNSAIAELADEGRLTAETFEQAVFEDVVDNIDWAHMPVEDYVEELNRADNVGAREKAVANLGGLIAFDNEAAFYALGNYLRELSPPATVEETHFRIEILRHLNLRNRFEDKLGPLLVEDLFRTPSNNTTRSWYTAVFRFFENAPAHMAEEALSPMLNSPQFSYRIKKRVRTILQT